MHTRILLVIMTVLLVGVMSCGDDDDGPMGGEAIPSPDRSTIVADPTQIEADGTATSTITVRLKDSDGINIDEGGDNVTLSTTAGSLSAVTDLMNGLYTATLTSSTTEETATVTGTVNGDAITDDATVDFVIVASPATSTITASWTLISADGAATSEITVQLKDAGGTNITRGGDAVTLATTAGTLSAITDNNDGTYTATLTSSAMEESANVTGMVNGATIVDEATVDFVFTTSVTLEPVKDNTIYEDLVKSNALGQDMFTGRTLQTTQAIRRALVQFDIAGNVPASGTIVSATFSLTANKTHPQAVASDNNIHKLTADWGEGTSNADGILGGGAGDDATTDDATWLTRFFPSTLWTSPGGDFVATASATQTVDGLGVFTWDATPQMVADVQDWLDNPGSNFGWIIIGEESPPALTPSAYRFGTRENVAPVQRPSLTIHYTEP